jgi:hypothetical protein
MIALRLNADTSDAQRNIGALGNSIEDLQRKLKAAQDAGNWGEAAKITQDIAFMQNPGFSVVGGNNGGNGSNLQNTAQYNNARQLDIRLETITRVITTLTDQLKESTEKGQSKESFNLSAALNNAEQEKRQLEAEKKRLETADKSDSSVMDMIKKYGVSRYLTQGLSYANQIAGIGFNHRIAMANGDYLGADVAAVESGAGIAQGIGGSLLGAGLMLGATPVGWGLMAAGGIAEIGGAIAKYWAGDARADIAEGEAYRKTLAGTNALNKRFSDGGTWLENSNKTDTILRAATNGANGTGLSTEEFLSLATRQSKFGGTQSDAMAQARDIAMWAQATGTDAGVIQNFLGTARRYGDNSDVLGYASQARQAAGLTKAQNEEFLQSLQSVIEDGIANGYVKSAEDVSKTFVMFSRLSNNNPLWQGEQGAKRLAQMNSGIAGATALQSVSDVIVAGAARDVLSVAGNREKYLGNRASGTYIDEMLLMEQGNNPAMFGAIVKSVKELEGGNYAARVERFKDIFKLNYAGAVDVAAMADKIGVGGYTEQDFANEVAKMQKDRNYQSEETKWQDDINDIATNTALMAKSSFWQNLGKMDNIAGNKGTGGGTASKVAEIAESVGLSDEETAEVQLALAGANNNLGLDNAIANGDGELAGSITTGIVGATLSDMGEYGKAAMALWQDIPEYDQWFTEQFGDNPEMRQLMLSRIGEYGAHGKFTNDNDVSKFDVTEAANAIFNPKKGRFGRESKEQKEIASLKEAYKSGNADEFERILDSVLTRVLGKIVIQTQ